TRTNCDEIHMNPRNMTGLPFRSRIFIDFSNHTNPCFVGRSYGLKSYDGIEAAAEETTSWISAVTAYTGAVSPSSTIGLAYGLGSGQATRNGGSPDRRPTSVRA